MKSRKELKSFIDFPHELYKSDPNYVPELYLGQLELHNKKKNPFFDHSEAELFLASKNGIVVGRVAAILNNNYNSYHNVNVGFFGFFEVVQEAIIAEALLNSVKSWCAAKGLDSILGPANYSLTTDTGGLLVSGFDTPPIVMMTYNKMYYQTFVEDFGFAKEMDLYAYMLKTDSVSKRSIDLLEKLEDRIGSKSITIRNLNLSNFQSESNKVSQIYKAAWESNWGFNPPTDQEFKHLADSLKLVLDEDFAFIAEEAGKPIGFCISLPNINEITIKQKKGRLFPFGFIRLLIRKSKTKYVRVVLLGVLPEYRKLGIEAIFYGRTIASAKHRGIIGGEASWILENNTMMINALERLNGQNYKTYRMYSYNI